MIALCAGARPYRFIAAIVALIALCVVAPAFAADQRARQAADVDRYVAAQMARLHIPGMAVAVVQGGRIALLRNYGVASVEFNVPVGDQTVFAVNSITKAFTGVAAMRLAEQGKLDLAAPLGRYLPDAPEAWRGVTVRQLLSHMSGLPDIMRAPTVETDAAAAWSWVQTRPAQFPPGERFEYCQTNYTLLQRIINGIEGRPLDAPLAEEQLRAAHMANSGYGDAYTVSVGKAPTYRWRQNGPMIAGYRAASSTTPDTLSATSERFLPFRRASSGLNSSARDMANWIIALQSGVLLTPASLETLWTPTAFNNGKRGQWGLGWQVLARGAHRAVGMTGGGRAAFSIYPEDNVAVVILSNLTGAFPEDFVDKIASIYAPKLDLTGVPALRIALEEQGYAQAPTIAAAMQRASPSLVWPELELNDWGYRLLSGGRARDALPLFALIVERYPDSGNAHDSLAQAYLVNGDQAAALTHYRRAFALDPSNASAKRHVDELSAAEPSRH